MKKKKHADHVNHERWLVSYADFITLLFAFFVIMYAISQADVVKFKKVSASIKEAFESSGPLGSIELKGTSGGTAVTPFDPPVVPGGRIVDLPAGKTNVAMDADPELQLAREQLEESIALELGSSHLSEALQTRFENRGLVLTLATQDLFAPGSSQVREDFQPLLDRVAKVVARGKRQVRIEGHADVLESKGGGGWELSVARATSVAKLWMQRFQLDPKRLGVAGYGDFRPVSQGTSVFDLARNRRIEVVILNQKFAN